MEYLIVLVVVVALGAGLIFAKLPGAVPAAVEDIPDPGLPDPADHWTPEEVTSLAFTVGARGYRMEQVDAALAALAEQLRRRDDEIARLRRTSEPHIPHGGPAL